MKVSSPFFAAINVPFAIRNEPHGQKIKSLNHKGWNVFSPSMNLDFMRISFLFCGLVCFPHLILRLVGFDKVSIFVYTASTLSLILYLKLEWILNTLNLSRR
jgi:hypothetical protein